jgi:hypothetical protein
VSSLLIFIAGALLTLCNNEVLDCFALLFALPRWGERVRLRCCGRTHDPNPSARTDHRVLQQVQLLSAARTGFRHYTFFLADDGGGRHIGVAFWSMLNGLGFTYLNTLNVAASIVTHPDAGSGTIQRSAIGW